jgi:RNA polymerase sigma-70 factor (ECF subfamily)
VRWFVEEVHPHDGQLKNYLKGAFPAVRDVDDVVQESYVRIWKARTARPIRSAKAFLFKVARHLALNTIRKELNSPETGCGFAALRVLDTKPNAAEAALTEDLYRHAVEALGSLPTRHRQVVMLHKLEGLSHREIAARLNLTERTVQKYCWQGIERCVAHLKMKASDGFSG